MTNSLQLGGVYILMAVMLVIGSLMMRREPRVRRFTTAVGWMAAFAAGFVLFTFRDDFDWVAQRLRAEATGAPVQQGAEIRIPMAIDGHFWVDARLNGQEVKFLIDSGATMTTVDNATAAKLGLVVSPTANRVVQTGNGLIRVSSTRAETLDVGSIERRNMAMHVTGTDGLNVLGMNFLSSLKRWGVEGRWLVLVP
ncbi:MAG TPA: TIGR02281 family clan AA aspartic protease [Sphingomicrobium sp.]|nr:TIGR02281 family clan AA aspartic protease [Sphingomicrobium sp.]